MKKKWFRQLDLANEQYLEEADPAKQVIQFRQKRRPVALMAACACLALILCGLWMFMPFYTVPPSTAAYAGSEYHAVIKELNMLTWEKPRYANNFEKLTAAITDLFGAKAGMENGDLMWDEVLDGAVAEDAGGPMEKPGSNAPGSSGTTESGSSYEEVTDNQVEGITEADRIKRSNTHIYYLDGNALRIFSIAGLDSKELGSVDLLDKTYNSYMRQWEFYLSKDCKTATVIGVYPGTTEKLCVGVVSVDVSDPENPTVKNKLEITGNYLSSRVTDGKLLLLTQFSFGKSDVDFDDMRTYVPHINGQPIPAENIILPDEANRTQYTVVIKLDENTLNVEGKLAFLSYSEDVYVSKDHIFLTHVFADVKKDGDVNVRNSMTQITCLSYDTLEQKGSVTLRGYVKDQWSMDEYEGILRVVTTTNATTIRESYGEGSVSAEILMTATGNSNASLYCVDLESFAIVASVEDFAPPREEVQSVRFDKETAYVCTSIEMSDPVFFFDLSDLNHITYKDTGTIEGFSTSLVNFGDGYLLGIGVENWSDFKVEIYRETETGVEGFCEYILKNAEYSREYKSYYIDRENQLLGLGVNVWRLSGGQQYRYILLHFDGYNLVELLNVPLKGDLEFRRGVYIDGFMYLFGSDDFRVEQV